MKLSGRVQNGVIVLDGAVKLPEGASVNVFYSTEPEIRVSPNQSRVPFPIVPSSKPGSIHLTNEMIAEILDQEDVSS